MDGGLGDVQDVVMKHFVVELGAAFAQALPAFPSSRHAVAAARSNVSNNLSESEVCVI